ncbi:hypothetical protein BSKO_06624 [Bryopsis sp. KO-2023]|nr:hypothetical protein BSKO_06624 [Bryopsis sp. KO-2023]
MAGVNAAAFHGGPSESEAGGIASWGDAHRNGVEELEVAPLDSHNVRLLDNVHPFRWQNPEPSGRYNLVVVGAGAAGLVSAAGAAGVGAKVAIVERHLMGGDCLNVGCVPSKALIRCARAIHEAKNGKCFGLEIDGEVKTDFGAVMERMRKLRADISKVDSSQRFANLGVDVFQGNGQFTGPDTLEVEGKKLSFVSAIVATGGRASVPPIPGLKDVPHLTNATLFNLTKLPARLGVIGGGPIGMELAQSFQRFGSQVTVLDVADRVLLKEEREAADIVYEACLSEGVKFVLPAKINRVAKNAEGEIQLSLDGDGTQKPLVVDALLVAAGRAPNVEDMGLEEAGVKFDKRVGVHVDDYMQTSNKRIYAVGDVCTMYKFTHVGDFMARLAIRNALFYGRQKVSSLLIPWATYTEPEIAHVGAYETELKASGVAYDVYKRELNEVDRAILDGVKHGYVKVFTKGGTDQIVGATVVADDAGNMISELTLAMQKKVGLGALASVIHPYPTQAEAIRQCGDQYNKTRLTSTVKSIFNKLMAWKRK